MYYGNGEKSEFGAAKRLSVRAMYGKIELPGTSGRFFHNLVQNLKKEILIMRQRGRKFFIYSFRNLCSRGRERGTGSDKTFCRVKVSLP